MCNVLHIGAMFRAVDVEAVADWRYCHLRKLERQYISNRAVWATRAIAVGSALSSRPDQSAVVRTWMEVFPESLRLLLHSYRIFAFQEIW